MTLMQVNRQYRSRSIIAMSLCVTLALFFGIGGDALGDAPINNGIAAHSVLSTHATPAATSAAHWRKILNFKPIYQQLMEHYGDLSENFDEPVWIGTDEVLAHVNLGDGFLIGEYRLNLRTGKVRQLALEPHINDCKPAHWAVSPDRKHILWLQGHLDNDVFTIFSTCVDGSGSDSWKTDVGSDVGELLWMPDGHRFVCFQRAASKESRPFVKALIYDSAVPEQEPVSITIPPALDCARIVGFLPDGSLLTASNFLNGHDRRGPKKTVIMRSRLDRPFGNARRYPVHLTGGHDSYDYVKLSPDGQSLAWTFNRGDYDKGGGSLWISRTDGTRMRRIGTVPGTLKAWYPNSRALLFEATDFGFHARKMELLRVDLD